MTSPAVAKLKVAESRGVLMYGYGVLTDTLVMAGLVDEVRLWVHPVFVGGPSVSAPPADARTPLTLADPRTGRRHRRHLYPRRLGRRTDGGRAPRAYIAPRPVGGGDPVRAQRRSGGRPDRAAGWPSCPTPRTSPCRSGRSGWHR